MQHSSLDNPGIACAKVKSELCANPRIVPNRGLHKTYVTVSEKTDHLAPMQFVQYGPKALQRSRSRDFAISMPRCSTAS